MADISLSVPHVPSMDSLEEITHWLDAFRERRRLTHGEEDENAASLVRQLEARYQERRAELS